LGPPFIDVWKMLSYNTYAITMQAQARHMFRSASTLEEHPLFTKNQSLNRETQNVSSLRNGSKSLSIQRIKNRGRKRDVSK